jgi:hypothetical protein
MNELVGDTGGTGLISSHLSAHSANKGFSQISGRTQERE